MKTVRLVSFGFRNNSIDLIIQTMGQAGSRVVNQVFGQVWVPVQRQVIDRRIQVYDLIQEEMYKGLYTRKSLFQRLISSMLEVKERIHDDA
jgi:hypothetical protein